MFGRWLANDDPLEILAEYRQPCASGVVAS
jgi:hypothetical protein